MTDVSNSQPQQQRSTLQGTFKGFIAEALLVPTGLITAIFLTRELGSDGYGLFTLATTIVTWIEWTCTSIFSRTTIKFIGEAEDWRPIGTTIIQQYLLVSSIATLLLASLTVPIANLMGETTFTTYLLLFSVEIPLFSLARAHRSILNGLGNFSEQAMAGASRLIARLLLIVVLVKLGFSLFGAIFGSLGASLVELLVARLYVRPALFCRSSFKAKQLWNYAIPITLFSLSMRLYEKLDLMALKVLGGTAQEAGIYGAAQNLSLLPSLFAVSFSPVLLSNTSRKLRDGDKAGAQKMCQQGMRLVLLMLPCAAMTSGEAGGIINLFFGSQYKDAAPILALLIFGAFGQLMISVSTVILIAADKPNWTFTLIAPLLPLAVIGHWLYIPRMKAVGAATVTTVLAFFGVMLTLIAVYRVWQILPPLYTLGRSILVCLITYALAAYIPSPGFLLLLKLGAIALLIPFLFFIFQEFSTEEITVFRTRILEKYMKKLLNIGKR
jgi:O-antigen/teichoic acid export membrane protein